MCSIRIAASFSAQSWTIWSATLRLSYADLVLNGDPETYLKAVTE